MLRWCDSTRPLFGLGGASDELLADPEVVRRGAEPAPPDAGARSEVRHRAVRYTTARLAAQARTSRTPSCRSRAPGWCLGRRQPSDSRVNLGPTCEPSAHTATFASMTDLARTKASRCVSSLASRMAIPKASISPSLP